MADMYMSVMQASWGTHKRCEGDLCDHPYHLLAEVGELRAQLDHAIQTMNDQTTGSYFVLQENEQLKAEVERLRAALTAITYVLGTGACTQANCEGCHYEMVESAGLAREALASPKSS